MGTQEGERDWVDVANDLLSKCNINLKLKKLTDCHANVFISLYENILGENVPDYIAAPRSQEDDIHNVQAVIDSLSLDYLQISLSHITGENVVIGDKESIGNLLEIFDGLLEYLNEEMESQNGGRSTVRSSKHSLHSWNAEEMGSTSELIGLGVSARTFTDKEEGETHRVRNSRSLKNLRIYHLMSNNVLCAVFIVIVCLSSNRVEEEFEEPLSYRRQSNRKAEEELHHISEKLSNRLEELDQMLKRVLGESGESSEDREEDKLSHHSDSIRECHRIPRHTGTNTLLLKCSEYDLFIKKTDKKYQGKISPLFSAVQPPSSVLLISTGGMTLHEQIKCIGLMCVQCCVIIQITLCPLFPPVKVKENELLPVLLEELPHLHISPHALGRMWEQQMQQVDRLHELSSSRSHQRSSKLSRQVEEAQRKHDLLVDIICKEQDHNKRLRDFKERIQQQKLTQNRLREQRQQIARAKKYHNDYHVQHRARLMRARTKEERMFRQLFEEGLELQKVRLREQRAYAREQRLEHQRRHQDQIKSMENYYKDQFSLLAEKLAQERQEIQVRKKAQEKALLKMKRELRCRMEREIGELQKIIVQNNEEDYIQDLEVQRLRNRIQMASFQYNTSYLH
uniref:DUF5745 domain-containing protein n=1 Tax=Anabas testudineus TaxID=64144 RepID=A0A7N6BBX7_ANATE